MIKAGKKLLCVLLAVLCLTAALVPVGAAIDVNRKGSVSFTITASDTGETIGGGSIAVYRVASIDSSGTYTLLDDYAPLGIDINDLVATDSSWSETAETVALYIKNHGLDDTAVVVPIDENGKGKLTDMETGLYVAVQKEAPKGYTAFNPFVMPIPYQSESSVMYDLDAKPKGTSRLPAEEYPMTFPVVSKTVKGAEGTVKTEFQFKFKALEQGYPAIVNTSGSVDNGGDVVFQTENEIVVRTIGQGTAEIGSIRFKNPGDYYFEASEINTHEENYQYDKTVYWCKYTVGYNDAHDALVLKHVTVKSENANGKVLYEGEELPTLTFDFVNYYDTPPHKGKIPDGDLPQTGQVWWPVLLLASVGAVCIVLGIVIIRRDKKKKSIEKK